MSENWLLNLVIVLGVVLVSMVLHELAHGWVAYWLGDTTAKEEGRLTLNPAKHLDPFMSILLPVMLALTGGTIFGGAKPVPIDFKRLKFGVWGMALVAVAGPLTNLILALVGFLVGYGVGAVVVQDGLLYGNGVWGAVWGQFVMVNLGFAIFNMIPLPPLDGSRVLYALAPDGARKVMEQMESYGIWIVLILVVALPQVFSGLMSGAIEGVLKGFYWLVGAA